MRKKFIAGNWKMNKTPSAAATLAAEIRKAMEGVNYADVVICPAYVALDRVHGVIQGSAVKLGAQDLHWEDQGAFTGKISADMLKELEVEYAIIGHSEQRTYFHETNESVNKKTKKALSTGLLPIVCVGETLEEREANKTNDVVRDHVKGAFAGISAADADRCIIAYEPVWAIGTGRTATPQQAQEVHAFIRSLLREMYGEASAQKIRILYGGSMKADNAKELLSQPDIDGGLIGGAALKADSFKGIVEAAR